MGALFRACYFHTLPAFIRVNAFMHGYLDTNYLHTGVRIHLLMVSIRVPSIRVPSIRVPSNRVPSIRVPPIRVPSIRVPCKVPTFLRVPAFSGVNAFIRVPVFIRVPPFKHFRVLVLLSCRMYSFEGVLA
jgi:hypothetical protein